MRLPIWSRAGALVATVALAFSLLQVDGAAIAATPPIALDSSIRLSAEPMLAGKFVPGTWASYRVAVENSGPAVAGEIRVSSAAQTRSRFGLSVELATGARQEHVVYGLTGPFGSRAAIEFVSGAAVLARTDLRTEAVNNRSRRVFVIAERPQGLIGAIRNGLSGDGGAAPDIISITPEFLPPRVEAWAPVEVLVWQDMESNGLDPARLTALTTWISSGGHLVIFGGSTGAASLGGFPPDLLPYSPSMVTDVALGDLQALFGSLPDTAAPLPALAGTLERGTALAHSGDAVVAARAPYGLGSVALVGIDPSVPWLTDWLPAASLWSRALTTSAAPALGATDDSMDFLSFALGNLPAVQLPPFELVALLIVGYILVIGPVNYFVLRRRDRREWAWATMLGTIVVFAIGAYALGVALRGSSIVVNELAVVQGAAGSNLGVADVRVGVYSPSRATFDVRVGGDALISSPPLNSNFGDIEERPVDVLLGNPATLRDYTVGFGALRGFRAEAAVPAPRVDADLTIVAGTVSGTLTNASDADLADVSLVFGNAVQELGTLAPGESRTVSLEQDLRSTSLHDRLIGSFPPADPAQARRFAARSALVQHASGASPFEESGPRGAFARGPVILGWRSGPILEIDVGATAEHVGETLFVLPARARISGPAIFAGALVAQSLLDSSSPEFAEQGDVFALGRGTITTEYRPVGVDGAFSVTALAVRLAARPGIPAREAEAIAPLPAAEQPDSDAPLAANPRPGVGEGIPRLQLFDRVAASWIEFEPLTMSRTYAIEEPGRYVDDAGAVRVRFVVRTGEYTEFAFGVRLEGTVQ